jgi:hypothetical protein
MTRRKHDLSQQDLRAMGASRGRLATPYTPDGERTVVQQLTADTRHSGARPPFGPELTSNTQDDESRAG